MVLLNWIVIFIVIWFVLHWIVGKIFDDTWRKYVISITFSILFTLFAFVGVYLYYNEYIYDRFLHADENPEYFEPVYEQHRAVLPCCDFGADDNEFYPVSRVRIPDGWTRDMFLYWDNYQLRFAYVPTYNVKYVIISGVEPSFRRLSYYIDKHPPIFAKLLLPESLHRLYMEKTNMSGIVYLPLPIKVYETNISPQK
jgi:hypothetical protein